MLGTLKRKIQYVISMLLMDTCWAHCKHIVNGNIMWMTNTYWPHVRQRQNMSGSIILYVIRMCPVGKLKITCII